VSNSSFGSAVPDPPIHEERDEFAALMQRVQAGCRQSIEAFLQQYGPYIRIAVRRRLHQRLRSKFDSLDFVQDVWASFFADVPAGVEFKSPEDLIAFLGKLARNKVVETVRARMLRQSRDINRERPLEQNAALLENLHANTPTPSEVVMGREEWDLLLDNQPLVHRHILSRVRDGKTSDSIADELGISLRTVRRVIKKNLPGIPL